jgi:hypothetical protein
MPQAQIQYPTGMITDVWVSDTAGIKAKKVVSLRSIDRELFGPAVTVAALTTDLHIVRGATGTLMGIEAAICGTIATGADRTVTLDLHKSTGAGAFGTVLSSTVDFDNASVLRTAVAGVISSAGLVDGDILRAIVTVAGAAGNQALGLVMTLTFEETWSA